MNCLNTQYLSNAAEALFSQYLGSYQFKAHHKYQTHCVYFRHRFLSSILNNNFWQSCSISCTQIILVRPTIYFCKQYKLIFC